MQADISRVGLIRPSEVQHLKNNRRLFDIFTSKEEYEYASRDLHNRFVHGYSKNDALDPIVSKYLVEEKVLRAEYPNDSKFAVCLTHDVDEIYPPLRHTLYTCFNDFRSLEVQSLLNRILWRYRGKTCSPYWNFNEIMDLEEKYGAISSFYFLVTDRDIRRFRYNIHDLKHELRNIKNKGWEVGLHGSYYSYNDANSLKHEKNELERTLGEKIIGIRMHYLRFTVPTTWNILAAIGFKYDTTFGFPDAIGFRNGVCHPFIPHDIRNNTEINILEIPMAVMDVTLFRFKSFYEQWDAVKSLIDTTEKYNGVLTLNFHNITFDEAWHKDGYRLYEKILKYCQGKRAWMTNSSAIYKWMCEE